MGVLVVETYVVRSLAEMERVSDRIFADEDMKRIGRGFHRLVEPATFTASIWSPVA
jgi:hypothetical protein